MVKSFPALTFLPALLFSGLTYAAGKSFSAAASVTMPVPSPCGGLLCQPLYAKETSTEDSTSLCLHGRVTDKSGEGLAGAGVTVVGRSGCFCLCDSDGRFVLPIPDPKADDSIAVSFIGFKVEKRALADGTDFADIVLEDTPFSLGSVIINANPDLSDAFCQERLEKLDIYLSPVAAGDPLNALKALPSFSGISESANPEFRGSETWASKVIFNGIAIDQPVRNTQLNGLGNFSLFNTELMEHLSVFPGPVPLNITNSVSGAVDIHTIDSLESNQRQVAVSVAEIGWLMGQKGKDAFLQVYGNQQWSPLYTQMNHTEDRLKSFSSYDLGLHGGVKRGKSQFKFFHYRISEKYEGTRALLNRNSLCEARQERQFGVFNYRYTLQNWQLEGNAGEDVSHSQHSQDDDVFSLHKQNFQANGSVKYWINGSFWWQAGLSAAYEHCVGSWEETDSLLLFRHFDGFLSSRWQSRNGISLAGSLRFHPESLSSLPAKLSAQMVLRMPLGLYHHCQISAGSNQSHAGPWFQKWAFCELKSRQISVDYRYESPFLTGDLNAYAKQESGPVAMDYDLAILEAERGMVGLEVKISKEYRGFLAEIGYSRIHSRLRFDESRPSSAVSVSGDKQGTSFAVTVDESRPSSGMSDSGEKQGASFAVTVAESRPSSAVSVSGEKQGTSSAGTVAESRPSSAVSVSGEKQGTSSAVTVTESRPSSAVSVSGEKGSFSNYGIKPGRDYPAANDLPFLIKGSLQYTSPEHFCIALNGVVRSGACYTPVKGGEYDADARCHRPVFGEYHSGRLPVYRRFDLCLNKVIFQEGGQMTVLFATFSNVFNRTNTMSKLYSSDFQRKLGDVSGEPYSLYFGIRWSW